jgi:dihydrofolate reductase
MRGLVHTGFMSLDGVVDSPGGGPGEGHHSGGWVVKDPEFVPEAWSRKGEELTGTTGLMFGRRSYEAFAPVWPGSEDHAGYKLLPKYVVSSTLPDDALVDGWGPTTILRSTDDVAALKQGAGGAIFNGDPRTPHALVDNPQRIHVLAPGRPYRPRRSPAAG